MSVSHKKPLARAGLRATGTDRLREAAAVQTIEENPLDAEQIEMFQMFEREGWSHEQRRAYLMTRALRHTAARD